ncbi:processed acidic surface protein [Neobacillus kokaensis]|uniref:Processed acidic surface protein n=1 Tax=Neobacillus kokaensis TaxID=2759023 RepID=A0ABQ3N3Z3_9BACI|nr:processed acidic surface protein [Neobacillus kokaensis]GHH99644.1 hypothetical protein AM1BK_31870 [Neobacillus kokaensis]
MKFRKILLSLLLVFSLFPAVSKAAIPDDQLTAFLAESNWKDKEELDSFLESFYYVSLEDFNSVDELKEVLGEPISDENLKQLLEDYGFESEQELISTLVENGEMEEGENVRDVFRYIDALDSTVSFYAHEAGTPITDENLQELLDGYGLTLEELKELLAKNDDSLENYEFIEDLDLAVSMYLGGGEIFDLIAKLGITDKEIEAVIAHLGTLDLEDPALMDKMLNLESRLAAFEDFDSADDLTDAQAAELGSIMKEMLDIFQMDAKYFLVKGDKKTEISLTQLLKIKDPNGSNLLIELYDKNGKFLADILITPDLFGSDLIEDTVKDIKKVEKVVKNPQKEKPRTIKGGKLPNTAGNYSEGILAGLTLIGIGVIFFRKRKVKSL